MDVASVTSLVSSVGFPIVCCIFMAKYITTINHQFNEELDKLRTALENNTKVMTRICEKLDIEEEE